MLYFAVFTALFKYLSSSFAYLVLAVDGAVAIVLKHLEVSIFSFVYDLKVWWWLNEAEFILVFLILLSLLLNLAFPP